MQVAIFNQIKINGKSSFSVLGGTKKIVVEYDERGYAKNLDAIHEQHGDAAFNEMICKAATMEGYVVQKAEPIIIETADVETMDSDEMSPLEVMQLPDPPKRRGRKSTK